MTQSAKKIYYGENNFYQKRTIKILKKNLTRSPPQLFLWRAEKFQRKNRGGALTAMGFRLVVQILQY